MADEAALPDEAAGTPSTTPGADGDADLDVLAAEPAVAEQSAAPPARSPVRTALIVGTAAVVALAGLTGWLGVRAYQAREAEQTNRLFVQVGRQGAINLTSIDYQQADADVRRILDSATDQFYDDFAKRAQPFIEVVKQAQSKSSGTVTEAGLESVNGNEGRVLVAVMVETSNRGAPEQQPRAWRMRLTVKKTGDDAKVSRVEFVS